LVARNLILETTGAIGGTEVVGIGSRKRLGEITRCAHRNSLTIRVSLLNACLLFHHPQSTQRIFRTALGTFVVFFTAIESPAPRGTVHADIGRDAVSNLGTVLQIYILVFDAVSTGGETDGLIAHEALTTLDKAGSQGFAVGGVASRTGPAVRPTCTPGLTVCPAPRNGVLRQAAASGSSRSTGELPGCIDGTLEMLVVTACCTVPHVEITAFDALTNVVAGEGCGGETFRDRFAIFAGLQDTFTGTFVPLSEEAGITRFGTVVCREPAIAEGITVVCTGFVGTIGRETRSQFVAREGASAVEGAANP